jgi:hypothetical protein
MLLVLAVLFLAACQPAALEPTDLPAGPAAQPPEVVAEAPTSEPTEALVQAEPTAEDPALPLTGIQVPEGWQALEDSTLGLSLAYPTQWEICQETKYSRAYCEIQAEPEGMGPPPRLYVSVYPLDSTNPDWEIYNFTPIETIREFMALPVGESMLKVPGSPTPDYFTYTRLSDQVIAGLNASVIENPKVWEAPSGTKDRVLFILTEDTIYTLGTYYETPEQLAMFEQVLASFQLIP